MMIPPVVFSFSSIPTTSTLSFNGLTFIFTLRFKMVMGN
jgi:hypothetical protein